jgi:hypothetical protein
MEVARLVVSAIEFVDQAIQNGTVIARVFKNSTLAGEQVLSATQRLEAQKYTLELWQRIWKSKAAARRQATLEQGFQDLWGEKGYEITIKCLAQLNVKFGEAFRMIRSIDPDTFANVTSKEEASTQQLPASGTTSTTEGNLDTPNSNLPKEDTITLSSVAPSQDAKKGKSKQRWYKRLSTSGSSGLWTKKSLITLSSTDQDTAESKAKLAHQALQQKLSPGTKFNWSVTLKEQLRLLIKDIDDWLELLRTLSTQCEIDQKAVAVPTSSNLDNPSRIRAAAKILYTALQKIPSSHDLDFKLEKERADSAYFERSFGRVEYVDQTDCSFKFPLLVSSDGDERILLLAETIYSSGMPTSKLPVEKVNTLEEIVKIIKDRVASTEDLPPSLLFQNQHTMIVIHGITRSNMSSPVAAEVFSKCSFAELLKAQSGVNQYVADWKRLQLACIIAISVLHLYETGWISEQFETNDFHFFGSADSQYNEMNGIAPYVSPVGSRIDFATVDSPFDCLKKNQLPESLLGARDVRLVTLFHRLGIVLFELGRGLQCHEIFDEDTPNEGKVLSQIEKIPFGRPYRDLVKVCLTGSLYAASVVNIDTYFNREVIEK